MDRSFIDNLKFSWQYVKYQKKNLFALLIMGIINILLGIVAPILSAKIILALSDNLLKQILFFAFCSFIVNVIWSILRYYSRKCSQLIYKDTFSRAQTDFGRSILKLENDVLDKNGSGLFIQRLTSDTNRIADIFTTLQKYLTQIVTYIGVFIAIFIINKAVFLLVLVQVIGIYIIERYRVNKFNENDKEVRKINEGVSSFTGEIVRGARDIKMLNSEESFLKELSNKIFHANDKTYHMREVNRKYEILIDFCLDIADFLLIAFLVYLIYKNYIIAGTALILYNYSERLPNIVWYLADIMDAIKDFNLSANRLFDIVNSDEFSKEKFGNRHLNRVEGNFEFKNVHFSYNKNKVLNGVNFSIKANSTVAFVGKSGAGKTTIFNLLCKMYEPTRGKILIDGVNIKELDKDSIRGNITIISQSPYIFNVSIKDNLKLVKEDLTDEEMKEACKVACLDKFIESLPLKYDTIVGEGGITLSGGQKQRLAIARALIQKTEIILFDEATSALDNETQAHIQKAIENMNGEYTILIIAHRLSTIINSDRIIFLNDGKIEAEGTHKKLMRTSNEYKHLYESEILKENEKK